MNINNFKNVIFYFLNASGETFSRFHQQLFREINFGRKYIFRAFKDNIAIYRIRDNI